MLREDISIKNKKSDFIFDDDYLIESYSTEKNNRLTESYDDDIVSIDLNAEEDTIPDIFDSSIAEDFCNNFEVNSGISFEAYKLNEKVMSDAMQYSSYAVDAEDDNIVIIDWETSKHFSISDAKSFEVELRRASKEIIYKLLTSSHFDEQITIKAFAHSEDGESKYEFSFTVDV